MCREQRGGGVARVMVDTRSAKIIDFPDLPPKGSRAFGGKRSLMGPEIGTSFDYGQRLFAYY